MLIRRGLPQSDGSQDPTASGLSGLPSPRAVTIGSFDGLHMGHRALIEALRRHASTHHLTATVLSFHPHPRTYFQPDGGPGLALPFRDRLAVLRDWAVDEVRILPFRAALANQSAEAFVRDLLVGRLGMQHLVIGEGFRFGQGRRGDLRLLEAMGADLGFGITCLPPVSVAGERASSSRLRDALRSGNMRLVEQLLGRPYCLSGRVAHGQKLGRTLGFPTLNIRMPDRLVPSGIFAVSVRGLSSDNPFGEPVFGVASLGRRPTVESAGRLLLEVHLFDWQGDAYGKSLTVTLHHFLRHEAHYESLEAMTAQIHQDAETARRLLETTPISSSFPAATPDSFNA